MAKRRPSELKQLQRRMAEHAREAKARAPKTEYGVFVWTAENRYPRINALKVYKQRGAAEKFAGSRNLVVREL